MVLLFAQSHICPACALLSGGLFCSRNATRACKLWTPSQSHGTHGTHGTHDTHDTHGLQSPILLNQVCLAESDNDTGQFDWGVQAFRWS